MFPQQASLELLASAKQGLPVDESSGQEAPIGLRFGLRLVA